VDDLGGARKSRVLSLLGPKTAEEVGGGAAFRRVMVMQEKPVPCAGAAVTGRLRASRVAAAAEKQLSMRCRADDQWPGCLRQDIRSEPKAQGPQGNSCSGTVLNGCRPSLRFTQGNLSCTQMCIIGSPGDVHGARGAAAACAVATTEVPQWC